MNLGDFGDPIFQWTNSSWVQIGLASYCRTSDNRGVFTQLATYNSWIESISNRDNIKSVKTYQCDKKAPCGCGQTDVRLTVSGIFDSESTVEHSWPMVVSFQFSHISRCVGTILSDSFISLIIILPHHNSN